MKQPAYTYDELDEILRGNGRSGNVGISAIDGMVADSGDCGQVFRLIADTDSDRSRTAFR